MDRRFAIAALMFLCRAPLSARAQTSAPVRRIAWLSTSSPDGIDPLYEPFGQKLKELGYIEGRDFVIDRRYSSSNVSAFPVLAAELIALNPTVIVTTSSAAIAVLKSQTQTIPVVFGSAADVVEQGLVKSLARPGGNITGVSLSSEAYAKLVELIRDTLPSANVIAILEDESDPAGKRASAHLQRAATALRLRPIVVRVNHVGDFDRAFADMARGKVEVLVVPRTALFNNNGERIAGLAAASRLPIFSTSRSPQKGALIIYNSDVKENFRRVAALVIKIFNGANAADLPIEQPDRFLLVANLRVAKALNIKIPASVLARADEVIQ